MPPKKRTANVAELPASERARRVMMELAANLTEVVALFTPIEAGQAPRVPLAASLADTTLQLLERASAVVKAEHISPIEQKWLPDELIQHVLEFVTGRRTASRFGAGGVVMEGSISTRRSFYREFLSLPPLRLVCKAWARIGGSMAFVLNVPRRQAFDPVVIATVFPNAAIVKHYHMQPTKPHVERVTNLLRIMMTDRVHPLYVELSSNRHDDSFSVHGAYISSEHGHKDYPVNWHAKHSFKVVPGSLDDMKPVGIVTMCTVARIAEALTSRMPIRLYQCNICRIDLDALDNSVKFNVPSVALVHGYDSFDSRAIVEFWTDILSKREYWECGMLPLVKLSGVDIWITEESFTLATAVYKLIMAVGVDRVTVSFYRTNSVHEWLAAYHKFVARK
jgi:hypothetical protein